MIDRGVVDITDVERGFTLIFSATPFPGHQYRLDWRRADSGGNWYFSKQLGMEGWLCPTAGIREPMRRDLDIGLP